MSYGLACPVTQSWHLCYMHVTMRPRHWLPENEEELTSRKKWEAAKKLAGFGNRSFPCNCSNKLCEITFSGISGIQLPLFEKNLTQIELANFAAVDNEVGSCKSLTALLQLYLCGVVVLIFT